MTSPADVYQVASGQPIYGGRAAPAAPAVVRKFDSLSYVSNSGDPYDPYYKDDQLAKQITRTGKKIPITLDLHGSSGQSSSGRFFTANVSGDMAFPEDSTFQFGITIVHPSADAPYSVQIHPVDSYTGAGGTAESSHLGFVRSDGTLHLISEHRDDTMLDLLDDPANPDMSQYDLRTLALTGGSMGAWAVVTYGIRRYARFAALYADRPRWRYGDVAGQYQIPLWGTGRVNYPAASTPALYSSDGAGSSAAYLNMIDHIANLNNKIRPVLFCVGRNDGFSMFPEHVAAVNALRAAGRMFVFAWNNGDHGTGSIMGQITASYPIGTFSRDVGYPLFTEHSLDQDPNVDLVGMINGNLSFRNVVETATGWSCEVTSIAAACTVKVAPISDVYKGDRTAKRINIPAANTWVPVSFPA